MQGSLDSRGSRRTSSRRNKNRAHLRRPKLVLQHRRHRQQAPAHARAHVGGGCKVGKGSKGHPVCTLEAGRPWGTCLPNVLAGPTALRQLARIRLCPASTYTPALPAPDIGCWLKSTICGATPPAGGARSRTAAPPRRPVTLSSVGGAYCAPLEARSAATLPGCSSAWLKLAKAVVVTVAVALSASRRQGVPRVPAAGAGEGGAETGEEHMG